MLNGPFIWHHWCPVWAQVWLQLLSFVKKNMSDVEVTFLNREEGRFLDLWRIQSHRRSMSMEVFTKIPVTHPEASRWHAVREKSPCHSTELRRFSQRLCQDKWDFADLTMWKDWQTKVVDDIKGPCRYCRDCTVLSKFHWIYILYMGWVWLEVVLFVMHLIG